MNASKIVFTFSLVIIACGLFSQNSDLDSKYWQYRERMRTKFGYFDNVASQYAYDTLTNLPGSNIPMSWRNPRNSSYYNSTSQIDYSSRSKAGFGDATFYLGMYMAVLATEYKLFVEDNLYNVSLLEEIKQSLRTIERLDVQGDRAFGSSYNLASNLNGFFIRYDGRPDYLTHYGSSPLTDFLGIDSIKARSNEEFSQDQVWGLLMGLTFIIRYVDDPSTYFDAEGEEVTLKLWAQKIVYRILRYLNCHWPLLSSEEYVTVPYSDSDWPGYWSDNYWVADLNLWYIRNPVTKEIVEKGGGVFEVIGSAKNFVELGNSLIPQDWEALDFGIAMDMGIVLPMVQDLNYVLDFSTLEPYFQNLDTINPLSYLISLEDIYEEHFLYTYSTPILRDHYFSDYGFLSMCTLSGRRNGKSINEIMYWIQALASYYNNGFIYNDKDIKTFTFEHLPLVSYLLHGFDSSDDSYTFKYLLSYIHNLLELAPDATFGPSHAIHDYNDNGVLDFWDFPSYEWGTPNRLVKPLGNYFIDLDAVKAAEFNGLDYMLLHNLYKLVARDYYPEESQISENFPASDNGIYDFSQMLNYLNTHPNSIYSSNLDQSLGANTNKTTLEMVALNHLTSTSFISSDGKVKFVSGNNITLSPGFSVQSGATFSAEINNEISESIYDSNSYFNYPVIPLCSSVAESMSQSQVNQIELENEEVECMNKGFTDSSLSVKDGNLEVKIYPNPNNGNFYISINDDLDEVLKIEVYNNMSKLIYKDEMNSSIKSINLTDIEKGSYLLRIIKANKVISKNIIII